MVYVGKQIRNGKFFWQVAFLGRTFLVEVSQENYDTCPKIGASVEDLVTYSLREVGYNVVINLRYNG